jgi:hypothetical protein
MQRNPPQWIYEFHCNLRQLLGTNRRIQAAVFAAQTYLFETRLLKAKIIQLIDNTPQQSHNLSQQPRNTAK